MEEQVIRISVRALVEFILQSGDIDNRIASADKDAMQMGARMHRKIQRQMGSSYHPEVTMKIQIPFEGFTLQIEGRADGVMETDEGTVIDEIKGVFKNLDTMKEPVQVHLAQAKCYAFIYGEQNGLDSMGVQMTYCHLETEEIRRFRSEYEMEELRKWFYELTDQYEKWARFQVEWKKLRNQSIKQTEFPYEYREGQKDLVTSVYRTILRKKKLFIQAPTGVGKTMATVFPAVKAVGEGLAEKLFYLTAKTITRTVAQQAFEILKEGPHRENGQISESEQMRYKTIVLTAKEKICFCDKAECNPDYCPYAKGHYDRINDAVYEMITETDDLSRSAIEQQAKKWQVCPFELGLDLSLWADAVICDYNYVFDPNARLKRFFGDNVKGEYLFLIDEAHNLVERGREMYSASLYKENIMKVRRLVKERDGKLARQLEDCNKQLLALKRECDGCQVLGSAGGIYLKLLSVMAEMERYLEECTEEEIREEVLALYFEVRMFETIYERLDENYMIYSEIDKEGKFQIRLFCVNPSVNLKESLDKGISTVFFSATLLPIRYYKELLSTEKDDYAVYARSVFDKKNRLLMVGNDVSTRYTRRGEKMYRRYALYLKEMALAKTGNYMAFFPSYRFMEEVYECFLDMVEEENIQLDCLIQAPYMSEEAREIFLEGFEEERDVSLMGFCVMGGIFSEGIDLSEDKLIGAAIIGTGLPQVCRERELLKEYFDKKEMRGFDYAYVYPGMNKVQQSAGRVIRTEEDRGIILLLDDRFQEKRYKETFPREWEGYQMCNIKNVKEKIRKFWDQTSSK
ncbi:ATP-dependent DNA helicase [Claveliimonas bilis]|uniref:ATP-dependent DNA helicase n=1 Tax=Claveliimonas bilis TaxID=3028070 RepID=UPI00292F9231|nr:helicase C-terminal domain-containing protein [Claveliimonas bilis]